MLSTLVGATDVGGVTSAAAVPGQPGMPSDPVEIFAEGFEVGQEAGATRLADYVGVAGQTHTADAFWLRQDQCNGVIVRYEDASFPGGYCSVANRDAREARNNVRRLADVLGQVNAGIVGGTVSTAPVNGSTLATRQNHAVTAFTFSQSGPDDAIQLETSSMAIPVSGTRFYTASVDVAELSCTHMGGVNNSSLRFVLDAGGTEWPITTNPIRACGDANVSYYDSPGLPGGWFFGGDYVAAGRFFADSSALLAEPDMQALRIIMRNGTGSTDGNDSAFDNLRLLDVTPQLDKAFSPTSVPVGQTSVLTFTVTNTSELAEKDGWEFTDDLPAGLVIADPANVGGSCEATTVATAGATSIVVTEGRLSAGEISCTIAVDVTSDIGGVYVNDEDNITTRIGLEPLAPATVEFTTTPELELTKVSTGTEDTRVGDEVTYTVRATNTGTGDYTAANPAVVIDDLSGVLDDADGPADLTATVDGEPADAPEFSDPLIAWSGPLAVGETVEITYTVTIKAGGDRIVRNVAFPTDDPEDPQPTPECDTDGAVCTEFELPALTVVKTASRFDLPAVGETVLYRVQVTNPGPGAYTDDAPATFTDDLTAVLDDATFDEAGVTVTGGGTVTYAAPNLTWTGALGAGATVTIEYEVTYTGGGDQLLINQACVPQDEVLPGSPPCANVQIPGAALTQWKQVSASSDPAMAGTELTYTLFFENRGQSPADVDAVDLLAHVLDDAVVSAEPEATVGDLVASRTGDRIAITGAVPTGETYQVSYTVTVRADGERGDDLAANFLVPNDPSDPPLPPVDPECVPADSDRPDCTLTPIAAVTYAKSVSASSDPIEEGTVLTYTITVTSSGEAAAPVSREDVLAGVLDDAEVTTEPSSSADSVVAERVGDRILLSGTIDANSVETVTYQVTVKPQAERGDHRADNFLVTPGEEPPADCDADSDQCTSTPLPEIGSEKSSDPASGETVVAGQEVEYTLVFRNTGDAAGSIDYTDDLSDVFDDADLVAGSIESDHAEVTAALESADTLRVTGVLGAGETAEITYRVTVKADADRADNRLANVLAPTGTTDPDCDDPEVSCTEHPAGNLAQWKQVSPSSTPVVAGTELTYTLFFQNRGQSAADVDAVDLLAHVLDDADVTAEPAATGGDLAVSRAGDRISITGSVPAGQTYEVSYTVTVQADGERGDDLAANFLVPNDPADPPVPPVGPECTPADSDRPDCTLTPIGALVVTKSVSAGSDPIEAGTVLTYTLTFESRGEGSAPVAREDVLTGVLDDATMTKDPESSDDALTVSAVEEGRFSVTGELAGGQTVTVVYEMTVKPESERGDHRADNFLVTPGEEPPAECDPDSDQCTSTPLPEIEAEKTADPASGQSVAAGQEVEYTLTFRNTGEAAGTLDYTDDLSDVFDDADLIAGSVSSDQTGVTAVLGADDTLRVTGILGAGETATVTYTVTVKADADRADNRLGNVLAPTGLTDPDCEDERVSCTEHPVGSLAQWKQVTASSTPVIGGTELTYQLFFENSGQGAVAVDAIDDLTHVLDDSVIVDEPASLADLQVVRYGERISITGTVPAGATQMVSYTVRVKADGERGDDLAANFLLRNDPIDPPQPPDSPDDCEPTDAERPDCTVTPIGMLRVSKQVSADSDPVVAGTVLTYTLTFDNQGEVSVPVAREDVLSDVLDDAEVTTRPRADSDALTVSPIAQERFLVTGELAAGQTVTVTYQVTVKPESERGNDRADNFLVSPGATPSGPCEPGDPECTTTPLPNVSVHKSSDPASGTDVVAAQKVTYTLFFRNTGTAPGEIDDTDDLSDVLDDATLVTAPSVSDEALTASDGSDGRVRITGTLTAGQSVTVIYTVQVKPDRQRGDDRLRNVVAATGTTDPDCDAADVSCTEHPVRDASPSIIPSLPITGGQLWLAGILAGALLLAVGLGMVLVHRRRTRAAALEGGAVAYE